MSTPSDDLTTMLRSLGNAPEDVAASLRRQNCRGYRGMPATCPVAVLMRRAGYHHINVDHVAAAAIGPGGFQCCHPVPSAVGAFVLRFDDGWYPELVERGEG
jgi:hypothetical protein